eukprot:COSAG01_NODE_33872_length_557_cov_0.792576_1_plen_35_part_01
MSDVISQSHSADCCWLLAVLHSYGRVDAVVEGLLP